MFLFTECPCGPVMLFFVLDSSESVGLHKFTLEKEFIVRVISKITKQGGNKGKELVGTRVGIIQYSHEGKQELLSMDDPNIKTLAQFKSAVMNMRWMAGGTYTGEALDFAKQALEESLLTHKVAVVLTDGRSDARDSKSLASLCTIPNMSVIGIGIGDAFRRAPYMKVLNEITCQGSKAQGMPVLLSEYHQLLEESVFDNVTKYICKGSVCPDFTCHVEFGEPTEIVFLMDGSSSVGHENFDRVKGFVEKATAKILSEQMNLNKMLRLSVIQYSNTGLQKLEVPLTNRLEDAASRLPGITYMDEATDLPAALRYLANFLRSDGRPNVVRKVIVFSDGRSSGAAQSQITAQAAAALKSKTELFAVTVGMFHELGICQLVSGKENNFNFTHVEERVFRVPEYSDLTKRVTLQSLLKKIT
ncbi:collagen alpha-1(VI) chain-like [Ascaphus truei]|uniref:collagen alpha-1(VI) chain-like n=1 Tax=Ascaphus truei TaxID=8439 RepID=UPI003F596DCF